MSYERKSEDATAEKTANPFRNVKGLPAIIPRKLVDRLEFNIECGAGEPNVSQLKVSHGLLITAVPLYFHPPLEYGDYVVQMNGEDIKNKSHFYSILKECVNANISHTLSFTVERLRWTEPSETPSEMSGPLKFDYYDGCLVFFPRAAVGLSVKAASKKVYVDNTDNGFNSIGRRVFFIGDCIVSINNIPCQVVADVADLLIKALKKDCIAFIKIERAVDPVSVCLVRTVLVAGKQEGKHDPKLQDDVILLCREEVEKIKVSYEEKIKPILISSKKSAESTDGGRHVTFGSTSKEMSIGMDPWNPSMLMKVPGLSHNQSIPASKPATLRRKTGRNQ